MSAVARILIAFDGSASARGAIESGASLFPGAEAVVVSIAPPLEHLEDIVPGARVALPDEVVRTAVDRLRESALQEARELAGAGATMATEAGLRARAQTLSADGAPWRALICAAHEADADLIACGTRGHGPAARAVFGSVSSGLVHHAGRPVLVVPEGPLAGGPLLVAFDGSEPAAQAVAAAGRLLSGSEAVVVRVWRSQFRHTLTGQSFGHAPLHDLREIVDDLEKAVEERVRHEAERGAELAREHGLDARARAVDSPASAAEAILGAAGEEGSAAIVVGRRGRGALASAVLGSVSSSILHAADRPVLIA